MPLEGCIPNESSARSRRKLPPLEAVVKTIRTIGIGVALLMIVALPAAAQGARPNPSQGADPLELLLGMHRQLNLSSHQISSLREVQQRLDAANRPLVERLVAIQRQVQAEKHHVSARLDDRVPSPTHLELARGPLHKIHENNVAAMEEVNALLTADQKRIACTLLQFQCRHDRRSGWIRLRGN
jgi:hypothetical protein